MLSFRTLGGVALCDADGRPLTGAATQRRRLALLAVLAIAGERGVVSRDKLVALLWPESDADKARHALAQWLFLLRRDLKEDGVVVGTSELRLDPAKIRCDVVELDRALTRGDAAGAEEALALYAGPFLDGFFLSEAPPAFERWVEEERARLARRANAAAEMLAARAEREGDHASAARWWEWLVHRDPLSTRATLGYIRALADSGDRAKALQHARVHEQLVRQELECEPDPAVTALARALREAAPSAPSAPPPAPAARVPSPTPPGTDVAEPPASSAAGVATAPARRSRPVRLADVPLVGVENEVAGFGELEASAATEGESRSAHAARMRWLRNGRNLIAGVLGATVLFGVGGGSSSSLRERESAAVPLVMVADFDNATGDSAVDPLSRLAAHWIARGLGDAGLVEVAIDSAAPRSVRLREAELFRRAHAAGATALVAGAIYRNGDSLLVEARIVEVPSGRVLREIGPVSASRTQPVAGLETLRQRTMGTLAIAVDPVYGPGAARMTAPPSYEAFRELAAGDEEASARHWQAAIGHYRRAASLDSTYLSPLVRATTVLRDAWRCAAVDSVRRLIESRRGQLAELDALVLQKNLALCDGNIASAYDVQRRVVALTPASDGAKYTLANLALRLNRPREVVSIMSRLDLTRAPLRAAPQLYLDYTLALHMLSEHERELGVARIGRAEHPTSAIPFMCEARALAVLGRVQEVRQVVTASLLVPPWQGWNEPDVFVTAADELDAHGHIDAATRLREELVDWLRAQKTTTQEQERARLDNLTTTLGVLGRYDEAWAAADSLDHTGADVFERTILRARIAALRGDTATADSFADSLARLQVAFPQGIPTYGRAELAAILGRRDRAMTLLREAIAEGIPFTNTREGRSRGFNHVLPEFRALRGWPPFEAFVRPRG